MPCMYTMYCMYTIMCICTIYIYIHLLVHLSMCVYFGCILCMYAGYVSMYVYYIYLLCIPSIYILLNLTIHPSIWLPVQWAVCSAVCSSVSPHVLCGYIIYVYCVFIMSHMLYLCCLCIWCLYSMNDVYTIVSICLSGCLSVHPCMCTLCACNLSILCMHIGITLCMYTMHVYYAWYLCSKCPSVLTSVHLPICLSVRLSVYACVLCVYILHAYYLWM